MTVSPFNKTTQDKIAAAEALGLSYWADHPATGCFWAVDESQQAHIVRWYRKTNEVAIQKVGKPRKVVDYKARSTFTIVYKDEYPTYDAGERIPLKAA